MMSPKPVNDSRIIEPLWEESNDNRWISSHKVLVMGSFDDNVLVSLIKQIVE